MLELLRKLSIKKQLSILVICTLLVVFFVIFLEYIKISTITINNNNEYTSEMFSQIKQNISDNNDMLSRMMNILFYNKVVQDYMIETDPEKTYELYKNVDSLFSNMRELKKEILDFIVLSETGNNYFLDGRNEMTLKVLERLPQNIQNYFSSIEQLDYSGTRKDCFIITSPIYSIKGNGTLSQRIGIVAIVVDARLLSVRTNSKLNESSTRFFLLDRNNNEYYCNEGELPDERDNLKMILDKSETGQTFITLNKKKYVVNTDSIPQINGKIVGIIPEEKLLHEVLQIRKLTVIILFIAILLLSIPFTLILNNILQPLNKFMKFMETIKTGNLKGLRERVCLRGYMEIEVMSGEFNNMLDEIDGLTHRLVNTSTRLYESELEKKQAELAYMKSQINPHFLYNTLESMIGTAFEEGAKKTIEMIKALITIFRYSVKGADIVKLKEELNIIKSYIYIQQVRFVDMFDVKYELSEDTLECSIPKIILQPIVENAIFHGLETKLEYGHLCIGSELDGQGNLYLRVFDDGVGMDADVLANVTKEIAEGEDTGPVGRENRSIGVINVHNRIRLMYGVEYGLEIDSKQGEGTCVKIKIPAGRVKNV